MSERWTNIGSFNGWRLLRDEDAGDYFASYSPEAEGIGREGVIASFNIRAPVGPVQHVTLCRRCLSIRIRGRRASCRCPRWKRMLLPGGPRITDS